MEPCASGRGTGLASGAGESTLGGMADGIRYTVGDAMRPESGGATIIVHVCNDVTRGVSVTAYDFGG